MKGLITADLILGNLIKSPHPQPLPTRGRGGTRSLQGSARDMRTRTPSPHYGGVLGWGVAAHRQAATEHAQGAELPCCADVGNLIKSPHPQPLSTGGRGGTRSLQGSARDTRTRTPSPHCGGGLGWGGLQP